MDSDSGSEVLNESAKEEVYIYCVQPLCALCKGEMGEGDDAIAGMYQTCPYAFGASQR